MPEKDDEKINVPWGRENPDDLTTGGAGSGAASNDTGGLDVNGNELGATAPGGSSGKSEAQRMDDAEKGAGRK